MGGGRVARGRLQREPRLRLRQARPGERSPYPYPYPYPYAYPYPSSYAYPYPYPLPHSQVLLCERWAEEHPKVKFVSCHPGWTATPAVDAAYGEMKKYLEPMRSPWQGAEGIAWLCVVEASTLQSGAFYLDRKVRVR